LVELARRLRGDVDRRGGPGGEEADSAGQRQLRRGERAGAEPGAARRRGGDRGRPHDLDRRQDDR
jgi:hypothetical protein